MTELSGTATEKEKVAVITKAVFRQLKNTDSNSSYGIPLKIIAA
jgi:hypothetical protein